MPRSPSGETASPRTIVPTEETVRPRTIVPTEEFVARGLAAAAGAPTPNLQYHQGPVIGSVEVVPIYWGAAWSSGTNAALASQLDGFFDFIVTSSYIDSLHEYSTASTSIEHGRRLTSVRVSNTEPGTVTPSGRQVTDAQIRTALQDWITHNTVPATTANTLYFIFLPPAVVSVSFGEQSCAPRGFCGYHWNIGNIYYAVIPFVNCTGCAFAGEFLDTLTEVSSHELAEAITDPDSHGWFDPVTGPGDEIGDICNRQTVRLGGYLVQTEWSNSLAACTLRILPPRGYAFINNSADVTEQHNLFRTADGHIHALWFNFADGWHHEDRGGG
jgi:hypothetical protein